MVTRAPMTIQWRGLLQMGYTVKRYWLFMAAFALAWVSPLARSEGVAWEPFLGFAPSASGRIDCVAMFHQGTLYVLGGQPYRCPDLNPCADPERGAADYLPAGGGQWLMGEPVEDRLERLGGGIDGLGRPVAFGGARGDALEGSDKTFFYDIVLGDQTEPTLARRHFLHTNFAWTVDDRGRIYAIGGGPGELATPANQNARDVERYDAQSDTWTVLAPLPSARADAAAAYDGQGHVLVFGGYDALAAARATEVLSYDIAADTWSVLGQLPLPAQGDNAFSDQRALLGANGKVYIVGGINGPVGAGTTRAHVYTYEPVAGIWGVAPALSTPRHGAALARDDLGFLYAIGGRNEGSGLSSNERLDTSPAGDECTTAADCSDGLACNGAEFCVDGSCVAGHPVLCESDEFCGSGGICRLRRYDLIDLSARLGGAGGTASAIDPQGRVVGEYFDGTDAEWHGFLYDGAMEDLGPGHARAIADDGWIAGDDGTAFVIDPNTGERSDLGTLGGLNSTAYGVAVGGWAVGQSDAASGPDRAFLARGPTAPMENLGTLGDYSIAHGVNAQGLVVGESLVTTFDPHADPFVFDGSTPGAVITPMPGSYASGSARAVNDVGHITGWVSSNVDTWGQAFLYADGVVIGLGAIPGKAYSIGTALNNFDQVVGYAFGEWVDTGCCGLIWSNSIYRAYFHDGLSAINLNDELPESSGWTLTVATGINEAGAIVGTGTYAGAGRAFLMVPHGPDQDGDGVSDALDNCPARANPGQEDGDGEGLGDACDNCVLAGNADQRDTNGDGFGNLCDADLNGDCTVNFSDLGLLKSLFFSADPDADLDGSGSVDFSDLGIMKQRFYQAPGPSGLAACP
jgi:probable HAF family extracellular repeat protein